MMKLATDHQNQVILFLRLVPKAQNLMDYLLFKSALRLENY